MTPDTLSNAKINTPFKISKILYTSNIDNIKTELTAPRLGADSNLEHLYLLDPSFSVIEKNNHNKTVRASVGHFNRIHNLIEFEKNVQIRISSNTKNVLLDADKLIVNNNDDIVTSPLGSYFQANNFHISSKKLTIKDFTKQQNKIIFEDGKIINPDTNEKLGSANKINYSLDSGILIMKGLAIIKDKNISVHADEIHYNPESKKIIKSINSKIINNS
jgi:lipopolysaccharide assembly outer membrane protein LptD (OstA)